MKVQQARRRGGGSTTPQRLARRTSRSLLLGLALTLAGLLTVVLSARGVPRADAGSIPLTGLGSGVSTAHGGQAPASIAVPSLGISAAVRPAGRDRSGGIAVPHSYRTVGWWRDGAGIGPDAPVVLVGHVDSPHGPAVFSRLRQLRPGAEIALTTTSGAVAGYLVDAVKQYPDSRFPTEQVYGRTARPTLRLITCGGYDWLFRRYRDNIVAFAHLEA